jgi:hypothetical protein
MIHEVIAEKTASNINSILLKQTGFVLLHVGIGRW